MFRRCWLNPGIINTPVLNSRFTPERRGAGGTFYSIVHEQKVVVEVVEERGPNRGFGDRTGFFTAPEMLYVCVLVFFCFFFSRFWSQVRKRAKFGEGKITSGRGGALVTSCHPSDCLVGAGLGLDAVFNSSRSGDFARWHVVFLGLK